MQNSRRSIIFLLLTIIGLLVPVSPGLEFLRMHGFDLPLMLSKATANEIATAVAADISFTVLIFWTWAYLESPRVGLSRKYLLAVIPLTLWAVCAGLPFFLYLREKSLSHTERPLH